MLAYIDPEWAVNPDCVAYVRPFDPMRDRAARDNFVSTIVLTNPSPDNKIFTNKTIGELVVIFNHPLGEDLEDLPNE